MKKIFTLALAVLMSATALTACTSPVEKTASGSVAITDTTTAPTDTASADTTVFEDTATIPADTTAATEEPTVQDTETDVNNENVNIYTKANYGWSIELPEDWFVRTDEDGFDGYAGYGRTVFGSYNNHGEEGFYIYALELGSEDDNKDGGMNWGAPESDRGYLGENSQYAFYWCLYGFSAQYGYKTPDISGKAAEILESFTVD